MSDEYIKLLEEQNDGLKMLLAAEQSKVINLTIFHNLVYPEWKKRIIPTPGDSLDLRDGYVYDYGGPLATYATISWHRVFKEYHAAYSDDIGPLGEVAIGNEKLELLMRQVENRFKEIIEKFGYHV